MKSLGSLAIASLFLVCAAVTPAAADDVAGVIESLVAGHAAELETGGGGLGGAQGVGGGDKITAISPDGLQILISKLQNGQRWAVGLMTEAPFTLSGNVVGASSSTLMWCEPTDTADGGDSLIFDCSSPVGTIATADSGWNVFAEGVSVPASFFAP